MTAPASADGRRECTCPRANHQHGTPDAYKADGCRCFPCRVAKSRAAADNAARRLAGDAGYVDAAPAREHLAALETAGMGRCAVATRTGITRQALRLIANGERAQIHRDRAAAILAVEVPAVAPLTLAVVDATGTRRRVRALMRLGWPLARIASAAGLERHTAAWLVDAQHVAPSTASAVGRAYDELWDVAPDVSTPKLAAGVSRARRRAESAGWPPPMAWDDDSIDDPAAPEPTDAADDSAGRLDLDEWLFLVRRDEDPERAAARCGVTLSAVEKAAGPDRHDRPDVLAELRGARAAARRWKAETWAA
ncbi:hypothetical protein ACIGB8_28720 [Promicromonospora sukumoe]|uniref:hypothetical protein n=1 Tax=Promicromonospora sukumoe TaxID=88382 RepID=UPI0037CB4BD4